MKKKQQIEIRLWNYIDGTVGAAEKQEVERLLASDAEWQEIYNQLLELHESIQNELQLDNPPLHFGKNVMEQIAKPEVARPVRTYINKGIIYGIAAFFIALLGGLLVYASAQINWAKATTEKFGFDLSEINLSKQLDTQVLNVLLGIIVVLTLMLIERYVSRNFAIPGKNPA